MLTDVIELYEHPAEDPLEGLRGHPFFQVARAEVFAVVPSEIPECAAIRIADVRDLMTLAFMRGATWRTERH